VHLENRTFFADCGVKVAGVHCIQTEIAALDDVLGINRQTLARFLQGSPHVATEEIGERKIRQACAVSRVLLDQFGLLFNGLIGITYQQVVPPTSTVLLTVTHAINVGKSQLKILSRLLNLAHVVVGYRHGGISAAHPGIELQSLVKMLDS